MMYRNPNCFKLENIIYTYILFTFCMPNAMKKEE